MKKYLKEKDNNLYNINTSKNLNKKNINKNKLNEYFSNELITKYYPSFIKEWHNGIFNFSKKNLIILLEADKQANKIIKLCFSSLLKYKGLMFNRLKIKYLKKRNFNKVIISKIKYKHTSNNVTISLYVYNYKLSSLKNNVNLINIKRINSLNIAMFNIYDIINTNNDKNLVKFLSKYVYSQLNIKFRIILLKTTYLDSSILSEYSGKFLKYQKARYINIKNKLFKSIKTPIYNKQLLSKDIEYKNRLSDATGLNNIKSLSINNTLKNNNLLLNLILKTLKFKFIYGINLKMNGRITRRRIAERALSKSFYRGSLKNIDSSFKRKSVYLLRNAIKPNIDYSNYNSKTRNGSFNVKINISNL